MKKIQKLIDIIQIPIKLLLIAAIVFYSYEYLNKVFINKEVSYGGNYKAMPENSIDVLVLGSSDAQYSFVPSLFYEDTGLYSFVRGTPCQPLEVSYEMLKESLKTQNPKLVVLEVFTALPLRSICEDDVCYVTAQYQMTGREKFNTINYLPKEKAKEYRNDFINYHNDWRIRTDYESILPSNVLNTKHTIDNYFGYVLQYDEEYPENYWLPTKYDEDIDIELDNLDVESLNNIYELCIANNIQLLLYKTPIDGITQEDQSTLHKVWEWADDKGVRYIDFIDKAKEMKFYMQIHSDSFHCNIKGASMITGYIADCVKENFTFKHIQSDLLDQVYSSEVFDLTKDAINNEHDPLVYLKRLANTEGIICLKYKPYKNKKIDEKLYNSICNLGCSYYDINYNYYAIIKDGALIHESGEPFEYEYENKKIVFNNGGISVDDFLYKTEGSISILYLSNNDLTSGVQKNFNYYPFPWDCNEKVYD